MKILRFYSSTCTPCKRFEPVLTAFADKHGIPVTSVNVEEQPDLAGAYDVRAVPTTVLIKGGEPVKTVSRALPGPMLEAEFMEFL